MTRTRERPCGRWWLYAVLTVALVGRRLARSSG